MCRVRSLGGTRTTITSSPSSLVDENEDKQSFSASLLPTAAETASIIQLHKEVVGNQISVRWRGVRYFLKNITGKKSFAWKGSLEVQTMLNDKNTVRCVALGVEIMAPT